MLVFHARQQREPAELRVKTCRIIISIMVKQGKYSVEIVNADGRIPFPEHTSTSGETFVEVEPEAEYYIRVKADSEDKVKGVISVDAKELGYHFLASKTIPPKDKGIWEYKDGKSYVHALKFAKANVRQATGNDTTAPFWTGMIEVSFYEASFKGYKEQKDHTNKWNGGDVAYVMNISDPDKKKGVKSDKGEHFEVKKSKRRRKQYAKGGLLSTITLRYCSTLGLIHAGVLAKPPMWDMQRLTNPAEDSQEPAPEPSATIKGENGERSDVFDLTDD